MMSAKKDVELERLKMVLEQNMITPWVKENGFGGIDKTRFAKALDQIGLTFTYKAKPEVDAGVHGVIPACRRSAQGELISRARLSPQPGFSWLYGFVS